MKTMSSPEEEGHKKKTSLSGKGHKKIQRLLLAGVVVFPLKLENYRVLK